MGIGGVSIWQLVIILVIVLLLFGTKRLRGLGGDLGGAIKGFKKAIKEDDKDTLNQEKASEEDVTEDEVASTSNDQHRTEEELKQKSNSSQS